MSTQEPTYAYVVEEDSITGQPRLKQSRILRETSKTVVVETYLRWRKRFKPAEIHRSPRAAWHAYRVEQNARIEEHEVAIERATRKLVAADEAIRRLDNPTI